MAWKITFRFRGGVVLCKLVAYVQLVAMYGAAYVLVATAVDRYLAICHPLRTHVWNGRRMTLLIAGVWCVSLAFATPQLFLFSYVQVGTVPLIDWLIDYRQPRFTYVEMTQFQPAAETWRTTCRSVGVVTAASFADDRTFNRRRVCGVPTCVGEAIGWISWRKDNDIITNLTDYGIGYIPAFKPPITTAEWQHAIRQLYRHQLSDVLYIQQALGQVYYFQSSSVTFVIEPFFTNCYMSITNEYRAYIKIQLLSFAFR